MCILGRNRHKTKHNTALCQRCMTERIKCLTKRSVRHIFISWAVRRSPVGTKAVAGSKTLERKGNGKGHIHTECPPTSRPEVSRRETHRGALRRSDVLYHQHRQGDVSGPGRGPETEPARGAEERAVLDLQALVGNQRRSPHAVGPLAGAARRANPRTGHWH